VTYFTSSKYVAAFRHSHGEPDIIQVRRTFDSADKARRAEIVVLRRIRARHRDEFLNLTDSPCPRFIGKHSDESKAKMRASAQRIPRCATVRDKISKAQKGVPKKASSIEKMRKSLIGTVPSIEAREKMRLAKKVKGREHANSKPCEFMGRRFECLGEAIDYGNTYKRAMLKHPSFKWV
jgi:hypothetical protein